MEEKKKLLNEIDVAIDAMDLSIIKTKLDDLQKMEQDAIIVEDSRLFAARIIELERSEHHMLIPKKQMKTILIAVMIAIMGMTAYAATSLYRYRFWEGDRYVSVRTTNEMSEEEARAFVNDNLQEIDSEEVTLQADTKDYSFSTVEEATQNLDMIIPIPAAMPEMQLEPIEASVITFGDDSEIRTVWITYTDIHSRRLGLTVVREVMNGDSTSFSSADMDPGSSGTYKSKSGIKFDTLTESNSDGSMTAHIATTVVGQYEYSLIFEGFDQEQREDIIDSADLLVYSK